jgi:predicted glycoside hydrolase/deacetylase ChbG (UPF0249 family)
MAIVFAQKNGVVKSTSMLAIRVAFVEAVSWQKEIPSLSVGLILF